MTLLIEYKQIKQLLYNTNQKIKRLEQKINILTNKLDKIEENKENENQEKVLIIYINNIIKKSKFGSIILVSIKQFLSLILQQSCNYCGKMCLFYKKIKVTTISFLIKIFILCQLCETSSEFTNKSSNINFNAYIAIVGLISKINKQSFQIVLVYAGISLQLYKVSFHQH